MKGAADAHETLDEIAGGKLKVLQKTRGYRFSIDSLLLSHFVRLRPGDSILEMGAGSGVVSLILAGRCAGIKIVGIEIQDELVEMAKRSVVLNGLAEVIEIRKGDARDVKKLFPTVSFDAVVSNPPYRKVNSGRINPVREKALARHEIAGTVGDFLRAAGLVLNPSGRFYVIYPATRMAELIYSMRNAGIEPKRLRVVYSSYGGSGKFALVEGVKEGGEELEVMPSLFIYEKKGGYTEEMANIFKELSSPCSFAVLSPSSSPA
jgi:tRNA1Val (adenine37-N6)-methyltransferase